MSRGRHRAPSASFHFDLASSMEVVDVVQAFSEALASDAGLDGDGPYFWGLCVREGLVNAIRHGNRQKPGRRVGLELRVRRGRIVCRIRDQGSGFDPAALPDPRLPENQPRGGGRGIFLMRRLADKVDFSFPASGGTLVRLEKNVPPATSVRKK